MDLFDIAPEGWWDDVGTLAADVAATDDTEDPTEDTTDNLLFLASQQYQNEAAATAACHLSILKHQYGILSNLLVITLL